MVKKTIHSWLAYLISMPVIILCGFIKVLINAYPHEVVIGAIVTVTIGYFGKRVWQKHKNYQGYSEE